MTAYQTEFNPPDQVFDQLAGEVFEDIQRGVLSEPSSFLMSRSFISRAQQSNREFVIDFGGTYLRLYKISSHTLQLINTFPVSDLKHLHQTRDIFFKMASWISPLILENTTHQYPRLGFVFSYPVHQLDHAHAHLLRWTKGFRATTQDHTDPADLLVEACQTEGVSLKVDVLLNDATALLAAGLSQNCDMGLILGTGMNLCFFYDEHAKIPVSASKIKTPMIVVMEAANFPIHLKAPALWTSFDDALDQKLGEQGIQTTEKLCSGLYNGPLLGLMIAEKLGVQWDYTQLDTAKLSQISNSKTPHQVKAVLDEIKIADLDPHYEEIWLMSQLISKRAGHLLAAFVAGMCRFMTPKKSHLLAVEGSRFSKDLILQKAFRSMSDRLGVYSGDFRLISDGPAHGAAVAQA